MRYNIGDPVIITAGYRSGEEHCVSGYAKSEHGWCGRGCSEVYLIRIDSTREMMYCEDEIEGVQA